jgi:hypothetical protein
MLKATLKSYILIIFVLLTLTSVIFTLSAHASSKSAVSKAETADYVYILKDFNGKPAVFKANNNKPVFVLDVYTNELPEKDQTRIINGIKSNSLEEIVSIAENYE